ncbi:MAG TPA: MarR family transcriptional regulator [Candidatus Dormibacteraeota bacterium]|nr:MarR family transcriptional regulator [Candidatus Dormibacteraeota bacterium]
MTITSAPAAASAGSREALLAYLDALTLAEPMQERLWQEARITLTQLSVLRELRSGPQSAGKLGVAVGLSPTSTTRLVDRLERRGLVSRRRGEDGDRRCVEVRLTSAGERLLTQVKVVRGSDLHLAIESMSRDERRRLAVALRRLVELTRAFAARKQALK